MSQRVVFDTNTVVSALLFPSGSLAWLRQSWQGRTVIPLVNKATMQDLYRVLCYPKFTLAAADREELLGDYLPFAELVTTPARLPALPQCRNAAIRMIRSSLNLHSPPRLTCRLPVTRICSCLPTK